MAVLLHRSKTAVEKREPAGLRNDQETTSHTPRNAFRALGPTLVILRHLFVFLMVVYWCNLINLVVPRCFHRSRDIDSQVCWQGLGF